MKSSLRELNFSTHQTPIRNGSTRGGDYATEQIDKYNTNTRRKLEQSLSRNIPNQIFSNENYKNQSEVYESQLRVRVKTFDREDYQNTLTVKMGMMTPSPSHNQILHIELTDESNHLFLYTLDISETDFLNLKNDQSILVDFQAFPSKLIEMFDLCLNSSGNEKLSFICVLNIKNTGEAFFNIVETNQFKALTHLSLKFREANDQSLKQYLATRLAEERATTEKLRQRIDGLEDTLSMKHSDLERASMDLNKLQSDRDKTVEQLLLDEQKKLNELKETAFEREKNMQREFDSDKKEITAHYESNIRELQNKLERALKENTDLTSIKTDLEVRKRELTGKVEAFEKENAVLQSEINNRRAETKELSSAGFDKEKRVAQLEAKISDLENQIRNKDEINKKNEELLQTANSQKAILDENIANYKKQIEKLEKKITEASEEITKGAEYIEQLENNLTNQKEKLKTSNAVMRGQEQNLNQLQDKIDALTKSNNESQREIDTKQFRIKELENINEDLKNKLAESQKAIETNQSMIQWLNKSLNETQRPAGPRPMGTMGNTTRFNPSSTSPYRANIGGGDDNSGFGLERSGRYSTTFNADKYNKYQTDDYPGYTGGAGTTSFGLNKTYSNARDNDFLGKLGGGGKSIDFDHQEPTPNKENYDIINKSMDHRGKNLYSTTPIKEFGGSTTSADFGGYTGGRTIQPIKYNDPKK